VAEPQVAEALPAEDLPAQACHQAVAVKTAEWAVDYRLEVAAACRELDCPALECQAAARHPQAPRAQAHQAIHQGPGAEMRAAHPQEHPAEQAAALTLAASSTRLSATLIQ